MTFAFVFDSVGAGEWLLLLAVLLVVMGPKRLPGAIRTFGNHYAKFRRAAETFKRQLMEMDTEFDRAVDAAAREAEEAAKIPDVEAPPEFAEGPADPEGPDYSEDPGYPEDMEDLERSESPEPPEVSGSPAESSGASDAPAEGQSEQTATDGDRTPQEP